MKRWEKAISIAQHNNKNITKADLIAFECPYHYFLMSKDVCIIQDKDCNECWDTEIEIQLG
jgi:hypothetical protein